MGAADTDAVQHESRSCVTASVGLTGCGQPDRRTAQRLLLGLVFKVFLRLPRIEAGRVRLLRECLRNSREDRCHQHQRGKEMPLLDAPKEPFLVV